jgi:hypothetical protein
MQSVAIALGYDDRVADAHRQDRVVRIVRIASNGATRSTVGASTIQRDNALTSYTDVDNRQRSTFLY